ncbi:hypothetical protein [Alkalicoccus daliensis]|uniref:Uncharacterized protein n=1 Tax=Alkalicoccus daliensis TaxID=745820 RepID=A0A1H0GVL1_9BACI|nr:hypothetical protein [Alkalicoccus daliensis]SDO10822.1 hypothetical protein SAMN04488053_10750 [Alkalicoccus daliensis]
MKQHERTPSQKNQCSDCNKTGLLFISKGRYFFATSLLPVIIGIILGMVIDSFFYILILPVLATNYFIASRKAPLTICPNCRQTKKRAPAFNKVQT